ncbi:MAG: PQQ-binding-like beta-propeller repeat protein [Phycisphaerae bacterium]|nr:PQQ-binding-like beta-propeller repeat protein [Phycisphaerae bacterium]
MITPTDNPGLTPSRAAARPRGRFAAARAWVGAAAITLLACGSLAQNQRSVFPDDSVVAPDALIRVRELHEAGNTAEALRVLQTLLDTDAEKVLVSAADPDIFYPVRRHVHDMLLGTPDLLARYREQEEPRAAQLVTSGDLASAERTRFLTPSGMEAALRLAQLELESARFESARLYLQPLEIHPDRSPGSPAAADCAALAVTVAAYLTQDGRRPEVAAWAAQWAEQSGRPAPPAFGGAPSVTRPHGRSPLDAFPEALPLPIPAPLQSVIVDADAATSSSSDRDAMGSGRFRSSWVFPTVAGGVVYASDGMTLSAWDAATLGILWRARPANAPAAFSWGSEEALQYTLGIGRNELEDTASVTVGGGVAVTATGLPTSGTRSGDKRIHAFDASTGTALWSADVSAIDTRITGSRDTSSPCVVRGPAVIDSGTAVVALRKAGQQRRITSLYLAGLDLYTGEVRWVRLVGGYGTNPWSRTAIRPEAILLDRGIVYRSDDMGITGAYEAATGRPVWVRLSPTRNSIDYSMRGDPGVPPYAMHMPVLDGDSIIILEAAFNRIARLGMADGSLRATREGSVLGTPQYLLKCGEALVGVSSTRVAFVNAADFGTATVHLGEAYSRSGIVGRCVSAGGRLIVPTAEGLDIFEPARWTEPRRQSLPTFGNIVVAEAADGVPAHLLIADRTQLHAFVKWDDAKSLLDRRVAQKPADALPLITYAELAHHVGRSDLLPGLADRALSVLDKAPVNARTSNLRTQLFDLLLGVLTESRASWNAPIADPSRRNQPIRDPARLDEILDRADRAADSSSQAVAALFERAWLRSVEKRWPQAVEALQRILLDTGLAAVSIETDYSSPDPDAPLPPPMTPAAEVAASRLAALLRQAGHAAYGVFDLEAERELAALAPQADAAACMNLARRYPVSAATPEFWRRAAAALAAVGDRAAARHALGRALSASEFSASIGRPNQERVIARIAGELVPLASSPGDEEPVYRLLRRLASDYPGLTITLSNGSTTAAQAADAIGRTLARNTGTPRIGGRLSATGVQSLASWEPVASVSRSLPGSSTASLVMLSEPAGRVALWAVAVEDGMLRQVWSRPFEARPTVVRVTPDETVLFWPTATGGHAEAIRNVGGQNDIGTTIWKSQEFGGLFPPPELSESPDRFATPLDGSVRPDDLMVLAGEGHIVVAQRRGRAAAFDARSGRTLWGRQLPIGRVFEAELCGEHLVLGGARPGAEGEKKWTAAVASFSVRDGSPKGSLAPDLIGDHPRWIRATGAGDAVVATSLGLVRFNPADGAAGWSVPGLPVQGSTAGWIVGDAVFVLTPEVSLWRFNLSEGRMRHEQIDLKGRISLPLSARVCGENLVIASATGLVVVNALGETIGADALDRDTTRIEQPEVGEGVIVALEADTRDGDAAAHDAPLRAFLFDNPSGKLLAVERLRLLDAPGPIAIIDGKVIIPSGSVTVVVDAPVKERS